MLRLVECLEIILGDHCDDNNSRLRAIFEEVFYCTESAFGVKSAVQVDHSRILLRLNILETE